MLKIHYLPKYNVNSNRDKLIYIKETKDQLIVIFFNKSSVKSWLLGSNF